MEAPLTAMTSQEIQTRIAALAPGSTSSIWEIHGRTVSALPPAVAPIHQTRLDMVNRAVDEHFGARLARSGAGRRVSRGLYSIAMARKDLREVRAWTSQSAGIDSPPNTIPVGVLTHVAGLWKGGTSFELYVNGAQVLGTTTQVLGVPPTAMLNNSVPVNIGRVESVSGSFTGPTAFFDGLIDEVEIYNRALSAAEVQAIFDAGSAGKCTAPPGSTLTALSPAKVWVGLRNSDAVGLRLDLKAEVFVDATKIGEGELHNVASGSSGFNNAILNTIPLSLTGGSASVPSGAELKIKVSARRTCFGTGHASGTPRLWYNGQPVDSGPTRGAGSRCRCHHRFDDQQLLPEERVRPQHRGGLHGTFRRQDRQQRHRLSGPTVQRISDVECHAALTGATLRSATTRRPSRRVVRPARVR